MNTNLVIRLKQAGFPNITRWEVENNQRRQFTVTGDELLPSIGALLSEFKTQIAIEKHGNKIFEAYELEDGKREFLGDITLEEDFNDFTKRVPSWKPARDFSTYRDDHIDHCLYANTPEEALAELWIILSQLPIIKE